MHIALIRKWRPINQPFVIVLIFPTSLVSMTKVKLVESEISRDD